MPCMIWDSPLRIISSHVAMLSNFFRFLDLFFRVYFRQADTKHQVDQDDSAATDVLIIMATTGDHYTKSPEF